MKYKINNFKILIISLLLPFFIISCNTKDIQLEEDIKSITNSFEESVAIIQQVKIIDSEKDDVKDAIILVEILNFATLELNSELWIDGIAYTDNGDYYDEFSGDGIYTSIESFQTSSSNKNSTQLVLHKSHLFKYNSELENLLQKRVTDKVEVTFGCDVSLVECPETDWWNGCWPFSSPCMCVEFRNCNFEITL